MACERRESRACVTYKHLLTRFCNKIIYTAIVGTIMIAAFVEWLLWLVAFLYCLFKVYQKAEHWSVRVLAVVVGFSFTALRYDS